MRCYSRVGGDFDHAAVWLRPSLGFNFYLIVVALLLCVLEGIYLIGTTKYVWESEEKAEGSIAPSAFRRFTHRFWKSATQTNLQETLAEYKSDDVDGLDDEDESHIYDPSMFAKSAKQRKISRGDVEIELEPPRSNRSRGSSRGSEREGETSPGSPHPGNKLDPLIVPVKDE